MLEIAQDVLLAGVRRLNIFCGTAFVPLRFRGEVAVFFSFSYILATTGRVGVLLVESLFITHQRRLLSGYYRSQQDRFSSVLSASYYGDIFCVVQWTKTWADVTGRYGTWKQGNEVSAA